MSQRTDLDESNTAALLKGLAASCHDSIDFIERSPYAHKMLMAAVQSLKTICGYKANRADSHSRR